MKNLSATLNSLVHSSIECAVGSTVSVGECRILGGQLRAKIS